MGVKVVHSIDLIDLLINFFIFFLPPYITFHIKLKIIEIYYRRINYFSQNVYRLRYNPKNTLRALLRICCNTMNTHQRTVKNNKVHTQGIVYMLSSPDTDNIYIGSTTRDINQRLYEHRYEYYKMRGNMCSRIIFEDSVNPMSVVITPLEVIHRCTKLQLRAREQYHISTNLNAVNRAFAFTTVIPHINNNDPITAIQYLFIEV
jgi:predicted GIY-YIG superfamily endonuclease